MHQDSSLTSKLCEDVDAARRVASERLHVVHATVDDQPRAALAVVVVDVGFADLRQVFVVLAQFLVLLKVCCSKEASIDNLEMQRYGSILTPDAGPGEVLEVVPLNGRCVSVEGVKDVEQA